MNLPAHVPLVVTTRNQHVERIHWGSVAVVDTSGVLLAGLGEPSAPVFSRSTLKPFQVLPWVRDGGLEHFAFSDAELALACGSHSAEDHQVVAISRMLAKLQLREADLQCGVQLPLQYGGEHLPPRGAVFDQRHHNCSGKHSAFLGYCCLHGHDRGTYLDPGHPLQQDIVREVSALSGVPPSELWFGTDGCNAPNIGLPLARLALLWARLAAADSGAGAERDALLRRVFSAMAEHPQMVSGSGRCDLALTQAAQGDWVAKVGADGVLTLGVRSRGLGIAIRIADGDLAALYATAVAVLEQLGLLEGVDSRPLQRWHNPLLRSATGHVVGQLQAVLRL